MKFPSVRLRPGGTACLAVRPVRKPSSMRVDSEFRSLLRSSRSKGKSCLFSEIVCRFPVCSRQVFHPAPSLLRFDHSRVPRQRFGRSWIRVSISVDKHLRLLAQGGVIGGPFLPHGFPGCDMVSSRPRSPALPFHPSVRSVTDSRATSPALERSRCFPEVPAECL